MANTGRPSLRPHPSPSKELAHQPLPTATRPAGTVWWRAHQVAYGALYFGRRCLYRFDAPNAEYGVMYAAQAPSGALVETLLRDPPRAGVPRVIGRQRLNGYRLSALQCTHDLTLVDLTGRGLQIIGADGRLLTGGYRLAQRWSRAFWSHPSAPDGILFRSRHDPSQVCAAFFDRDPGAWIVMTPGEVPGLAATLRTYGYQISDDEAADVGF